MATSIISKLSVETTSTISRIATAASGCTITEANFARWGNLGYLRIIVKSNSAIASGSSKTVATVVAEKKPVYATYGISSNNYPDNKGTLYGSSGDITITGPVSADTTIAFSFMYLLN